MTLPELEKARVTKLLNEFCSKVPDHVKHQVKHSYSIKGNEVILFEDRFTFRKEWVQIPVAKFKYDPKSTCWSLWWPDSKKHFTNYYEEIKGAKSPGIFGSLLDEVERDPMEIFWG